jgi:hypothetical protein
MPITSIKWDAGNLVISSRVKAYATTTKSKTNKRPKN